MLGVRSTTCNDLTYLETGFPDAKTMILQRQQSFLKKLLARPPDYVSRAIDLAIATRSPMGKKIQTILDMRSQPISDFNQRLRQTVSTSTSSRRMNYRFLNPTLGPCKALSSNIPEHDRIALTRIRLGSHHLKIETGRWARIPAEDRTCPCGTGVQDESHVLLKCPDSQVLRIAYGFHTIHGIDELLLLDEHKLLAEYCRKILNLFRT